MSKFRPLDNPCRCGGTITARCWVRGQRSKVDGKYTKVSSGYWELKCDTCKVISKQY